MLESPAFWWAIVNFAEAIIGFKEETGRGRVDRVREAAEKRCLWWVLLCAVKIFVDLRFQARCA